MKFSEFRQLRPKTNPNVVVFVCEDDFLVDESRAVWAEILGPEWVFEKLPAKEFDDIETGRLMDEARTPSLFSQNRVLMVGNAEKVSKRRGEELVALQDIPNSSLKVVLVSSGGKAPEGWMKALPGVVIDPLKPADVARWLVDRYGISAEVARLVVESAGTELYPLHNEMLKLEAYLGGSRPAELRDVEVSILHVDRFGPWELDDALLERNYQKAVSVVAAMLEDGVEPLLILAKVVRVWRQLFIGKGLAGKRSANEVAVAAGLPPFKGAVLAASSRKYTWAQLVNGFRELLNADRAFKSSAPNVEVYFDMLLWKLLS
ncbi:MAG TPA: DNA polymerase III subunit delta [Terriglobia bacterium]|nr:DNA polymerase III subunit delta [Terriglobia bacterium]